jgi:hypothetical protein
MAKGFKPTAKKEKESPNYKTIFERLKEKSGDEPRSWQWYRKTLKSMALEYKQHPDHIIRDEKRDRNDKEESEDTNRLRRYARQGRMFLFEYKAKMKYLPYYDQFPLVYVIAANRDHFYGANLHYIEPRKRAIVISKLKEGKIDIPRSCIHKYITDHVDGFLLDLASAEWETSIALPVESFVKEKNGKLMPYKSSDVWKETNENYGDRLKAKRIIKGYGKPSDIEEAR